MESECLKRAREYEREQGEQIREQDRPLFHLASRVGWMNDPNGFSLYKGQYHMFYQYHPYSMNWGPMHWGHAVSRDLLHWEYLPAAIAPDQEYDKDGCFSGSAIQLKDGRQLLMYTGVRREEQEDGETRDIQTQCVAIGDGENYEKYKANPVLTAIALPDGGSPYDFRDPKIWQEVDGNYACVVGNCDGRKDGQILLYRSEDGVNWKYETTLIKNQERVGRMWECPDFFSLDGKNVLITSPQEIMPKGLERHNGNGTICVIGTGVEDFKEETIQTLDHGIDFYAPQTVLTEDGRRIMIGWLQNWDTSGSYRGDLKWFGQMSLPRELKIVEGHMLQTPIRELENLRTEKVSYENVAFKGNSSRKEVVELAGIQGRSIDLELDVRPVTEGGSYHSFTLQFAKNGDYYTSIEYHPHESVVEIDRTYSGTRSATIHKRSCKVRENGGRIKMRLILDRFSAELFLNDGEQVMSMTLYTDEIADGISFAVDGAAKMNVTKYELEG